MTNLPRTARKNLTSKPFLSSLRAAALVMAGLAGIASASAQTSAVRLADRVTSAVDNHTRAALTGSMPPRAQHAADLGAIAPDSRLQGITLAFSRTAAQQADLSALILAQQTPGSPQFHQWLTPAQFGARFGVSDSDLAATESWLQSQGFTIDAVSPSRESITFSGNASSVESAFGTPLHYFRANSDTITHFAPAGDLTVPAALSPVVLAVANLSNYRARAHSVLKPAYTSSQSGSNFVTPKDIATIYDINSSYNAGYTGLGQTIAVIGQTAVLTSDITNFQTAAGVTANPIVPVLVPNSGSSTVNPNGSTSGDEAESDLDLEYSSAIAYKATIDFVYTGNNSNLGVFQSMIYAIQQDLAPIITLSYGICEPDLGTYYYNYYDSYFQQAAAQGQTVINSSGDNGSTSCFGDGTSTANQQQLAVSYPASSAYVTGLGGTEFPAAYITYANSSGNVVAGSNSGTYWQKASGTDVISSALSYIPEQAWNDDSSSGGLSSGGGGVSIYAARPSWQTGVIGIPAGTFRLIPDVSLDSSPNNAGYLYCSSDPSTQISGSCSSGFRASNGTSLTVAGGTSFAAPIFAGMLAIINQAKGYPTGQGLIGPTLYSLASNSTTYASAFHDVSYILGVGSNGNNCNAGASYCSGTAITSYPTTTGYDEATGLGSVDLTKLISVWPSNASSSAGLSASNTTVTPNTVTPALSTGDNITIQVASKSGTGTTPTGKVAITDNGTAVAGSPFTISGGTYTYSYSSATAGVHTLAFIYAGDGNYATSRSTVILNVNNSSFTISVASPTISIGSNGSLAVTVTPVNGYTGTVQLYLGGSASTNSGTEITNFCFSNTPYSITIPSGTTAPVSASYTVYTTAAACTAAGLTPFRAAAPKAGLTRRSALNTPSKPARRGLPTVPAATFAGLLGLFALAGFKRGSRLLRGGIALGMVLMLGLSGLGLSGCSSGAKGTTTTTTTTTTGAGTFNFVVYANDSTDLAITNGSGGTAFTITLQ